MTTCTCVFNAIGALPETELIAVRNDDNFFDFDIEGTDLDAGDLLWFRAATQKDDLTDADAEFTKIRGAGIATVDAGTGKFQVQLEPADTVNLLDEAYVFHCIIRKIDVNMDTTLARGVMRLS